VNCTKPSSDGHRNTIRSQGEKHAELKKHQSELNELKKANDKFVEPK